MYIGCFNHQKACLIMKHNHIFDKIINIRCFAVVAAAVLFASLVPVLYCGFFNYATADDFAKSYMAADAVREGGSFFAAVIAAFENAVEAWKNWEGTWTSDFILAFQPSIWGEHWYGITVPLCVIYTVSGTGYLLWEIIVRRMGLRKAYWTFIWFVTVFLMLQYMPFPRGGIFWYPGMAHYIMPMCFAFLMIGWLLKWMRTAKSRYYWLMLLDSIYLGGSHYQLILLIELILAAAIVLVARHRPADKLTGKLERNQKYYSLILVFFLFTVILIGLIICVLSPGNKVRGGAEFSFSLRRVITIPFLCVASLTKDLIGYFTSKPIILILPAICFYAGLSHDDSNISFSQERCETSIENRIYGDLQELSNRKSGRKVFALILFLFLLTASSEAPGLYVIHNSAGISGGYYDVTYCLSLMMMALSALILGLYVSTQRVKFNKRLYCLGVLIFGLLFLKRSIRSSECYTCLSFAAEGRLQDYVDQMEERISLLEDPLLTDVVVPAMNDQQGPFMHLALSEDPSNYTNQASCLFYNKKSIKAVDRELYYEMYAAKEGHPDYLVRNTR